MDKNLLMGLGRSLWPIPPFLWRRQVQQNGRHETAARAFMTPDHVRIHHFVVAELPRFGRPLPPEHIAEALSLPLERVVACLDDLERHMTFLFRNPQGQVAWAYPVTVEPTPHRIEFKSGEELYAAWAIDALATPFVQGQLRHENLEMTLHTECGHCQQPIEIEINSALQYRVLTPGAQPVIVTPSVNFQKLKDPSIIDAF